LFIASLRLLQQRNEIMQSFFVAVNNSLKKFIRSTRCQLPPRHPPSLNYQPAGNPHHIYFSTASTPPPSLAFRRCVVQRGANTNASAHGLQAFSGGTYASLIDHLPPMKGEVALRPDAKGNLLHDQSF
jgi:hypothetical protein